MLFTLLVIVGIAAYFIIGLLFCTFIEVVFGMILGKRQAFAVLGFWPLSLVSLAVLGVITSILAPWNNVYRRWKVV